MFCVLVSLEATCFLYVPVEKRDEECKGVERERERDRGISGGGSKAVLATATATATLSHPPPGGFNSLPQEIYICFLLHRASLSVSLYPVKSVLQGLVDLCVCLCRSSFACIVETPQRW